MPGLPQLLPQGPDVYVQRPVFPVRLQTPYPVHKHLPGHHPALLLQQQRQYLKLLVGQKHILPIHLLLSALLLGLMFFLPLAHAIGPENSVFRIMVWGYDDPTASSSPIVNSLTLAATALLGATIVLEIITVFRYKKRRLQKRLCTVQIVLLLLTAGVTALYLKSFGEEGFGPVALSVTAAFPLVAAILTLLARRGIVKDDKLVRSLDRIR